VPLRWIEGGALAPFPQAHRLLEIVLARAHSISAVLVAGVTRGVRMSHVVVQDDADLRRLRVELEAPVGRLGERIVDALAELEGVRAVRWRR
jgi:hypothetical protein